MLEQSCEGDTGEGKTNNTRVRVLAAVLPFDILIQLSSLNQEHNKYNSRKRGLLT